MAMLKISTDKLMLVAGIVWAIAGANIANIGLTAYQHDWGWVIWALLVGSAVIFVLFHSRIFQKMVGKHAKRIGGYEEAKTNILKFFDKKGYIMMAIMMGGGIGLPTGSSRSSTRAWASRSRWRASPSCCVTS